MVGSLSEEDCSILGRCVEQLLLTSCKAFARRCLGSCTRSLSRARNLSEALGVICVYMGLPAL